MGILLIGLVLVLSLVVAVSASTSSINWSFGSGGAQAADVSTPVTKTVEKPAGPEAVNVWSSDPVGAPTNASVGSDRWSNSGPVSSPSTQGMANTDGWST